jgi:hypothetical protein
VADPSGSRATRRRRRAELEIAAAVARERLVTAHVEQALSLIEGAGDRLSPQRALAIYARLHRLGAQEAKLITNRTLAILGERVARSPLGGGGEAGEPPADSPRSLLQQIRHRLRGRTQHELRRWVELHTGRAEVALLEVHVDNALRFVNVLGPERSVAEAVEEYTATIGVRPTLTEVVYYFVLDRLSRAASPAVEPAVPRPHWPEPQAVNPTEHSLRILKDRGPSRRELRGGHRAGPRAAPDDAGSA